MRAHRLETVRLDMRIHAQRVRRPRAVVRADVEHDTARGPVDLEEAELAVDPHVAEVLARLGVDVETKEPIERARSRHADDGLQQELLDRIRSHAG